MDKVAGLLEGRKLKWGGIAVAIFLIGLVAGVTLNTSFFSSPSSTSSMSTSTISSATIQQQASSTIQQQAVTSGNETFRIQVLAIALDQADASIGYSDYLLSVNASYVGPGSWQLDVNNFHLATNELSVSNVTALSSEKNPLTNMVLLNGQHGVGQVAFEVLNGQTPVRLQYYVDPSTVLAHDKLPQISSWISVIPVAIVNFDNPTHSNLTVTASILNSTVYFYSGDVILVKIAVTYVNIANDPASLTLSSIAELDQGFVIRGIQPSIPRNIPGNNQEVDFTVSVSPPHYSYSGGINIGVAIVG